MAVNKEKHKASTNKLGPHVPWFASDTIRAHEFSRKHGEVQEILREETWRMRTRTTMMLTCNTQQVFAALVDLFLVERSSAHEDLNVRCHPVGGVALMGRTRESTENY